MQRLPWVCAVGAAVFSFFHAPLAAHGGGYKGPPDMVPPSNGGGRPTTPSGPTGPTTPTTGQPTGPTAPAPTAPPTGGQRNPTSPRPSAPPQPHGRTGGGTEAGPDFTEWSYWWNFNSDPYLRLKESVHDGSPTTGDSDFYLGKRRGEGRDLLRPTRAQVQELLPALKRAIDSTEQRDITSAGMIAMAKIGQNHTDFRLIDVFQPRLAAHDQEIRETAALALGIAAVDGAGELQLLCDLALDTEAARRISGRAVDNRTRAFALYAIGMFASEHSELPVREKALDTLRQVLTSDDPVVRDLPVAAIHGIGMLRLSRATAAEARLQDVAIDCLDAFYRRQLGAGQQLIQAHCPTAITKLLGRDHPRLAEFKRRFADDLAGTGALKRSSDDIARSCALALGRLCAPDDDGKGPDASYSELLWRTHDQHGDVQTQNFALLALGQIGGAVNRERLLLHLPHAKAATERPWCALALGVLAFPQRSEDRVDLAIGDALLKEFRDAKTPALVQSLAVALGLVGHADASADLQATLTKAHVPEDNAAYLCIGLALLHDLRARPAVREAFASASRKPVLLEKSAIALGCLGDKEAATILQEKMAGEDVNLATLAALATAIGRIGDRRSLDTLTKLLADASRAPLPRAFAAVALGCIADRADLPWTSKISLDINYRAVVETLLDTQSGILDLL
ncbi:MAG: hypothetical protein IT455_11540 [Planctomycetes bacterium]|nr:hypothetical protein [Planctomycetota bacterium]